jgi:hypothetical protein
MSSEEAHGHQKVQLALNLSTSPPHTVSSKDATPAEPMKLIATIKQTVSPFPDRAVIILTKYSCLETDAPGSDGAFFTRAMASPQTVVQDDQCPAPELIMRPTQTRNRRSRLQVHHRTPHWAGSCRGGLGATTIQASQTSRGQIRAS